MHSLSSTACVCARDARVVNVTVICREHIEVEFVLPEFPASNPGQFLQVRCADEVGTMPTVLTWPADEFPSPELGDRQRPRAFLRRPFSIADQWQDDSGQTHLCVISRGVGVGTGWLERLRPGEALNITGPLGHGFDIPGPDVPVVCIGGGVGIPPLLYLARRLQELGHRDVTAVFGATTRELLPLRLSGEPAADGTPRRCVELPAGAPFEAIITTDDGSLGMAGLVTDAVHRWCVQPNTRQGRPTALACGPEPMLWAAAGLTRKFNLDCQLCIERTMGCGLGTCLSCVVRVADSTRPDGWRWALACSDGPVFDRDALLDYRVG